MSKSKRAGNGDDYCAYIVLTNAPNLLSAEIAASEKPTSRKNIVVVC